MMVPPHADKNHRTCWFSAKYLENNIAIDWDENKWGYERSKNKCTCMFQGLIWRKKKSKNAVTSNVHGGGM